MMKSLIKKKTPQQYRLKCETTEAEETLNKL